MNAECHGEAVRENGSGWIPPNSAQTCVIFILWNGEKKKKHWCSIQERESLKYFVHGGEKLEICSTERKASIFISTKKKNQQQE